MNLKVDFLLIGGGVVGLAIADSIKSEWPDAKIVVIDKEPNSISHASGRNSGVIHAGFYYSPDSLKAKLTRDGNQQLKQFCSRHNIPVRATGKVVVTTGADQLDALEDLHQRGIANGVDLRLVNEKELKKIEPLARTHQVALWSPNTAVADPKLVTEHLSHLALANGIDVKYGMKYLRRTSSGIFTTEGEIKAKHIINCAGLYADVVARDFGFCDDYVVLPFTGLYAYAPRLRGSLCTHVYPVPDPKNPFLGVHATVTINGDVKIGPTAIPALSREAYRAIRDIRADELIEILKIYPSFLSSRHHQVFRLISTELPKYSRTWLVHEAKKLVPSLKRTDFTVKGQPGIRAQMFDIKNKKLEMDFVVRGDSRSTHVLNAVSPAWTSSLAVAQYVRDDIKERLIA